MTENTIDALYTASDYMTDLAASIYGDDYQISDYERISQLLRTLADNLYHIRQQEVSGA